MKLKKWLKDKFEEKVIGSYMSRYHFDIKNKFKAEDVFIVGYPKSGNTWMQNIVAGLMFGIDTTYLPDRLTQELVPPVANRKIFKRFLDFTCFKSHELPQKNYKRVILLVRDGRDVMPSYKAMNDKMGKSWTLDQMINEGLGLYPCKWVDFYKQWTENPYGSEIMVLKYENLRSNTFETLEEICAFLKIEREAELLNRIIEGNSFDKMRAKAESFGFDNRAWNKGAAFFRKGEVGSYESDFNAKTLKTFEEEAYPMLKYFEYV